MNTNQDNKQQHRIEMNLVSAELEKCAICGRWTYNYARCDGLSFHLCDAHHTKEHFFHLLNTRK